MFGSLCNENFPNMFFFHNLCLFACLCLCVMDSFSQVIEGEEPRKRERVYIMKTLDIFFLFNSIEESRKTCQVGGRGIASSLYASRGVECLGCVGCLTYDCGLCIQFIYLCVYNSVLTVCS